ncbi:hypothetical protein EMEDMD4_340032 [Sinorhizobium medicae]|uniref:Uncharacterized protein n=1 Tax=Sinorhizobium medicae TaxID=110321 RepID=A0A508WXN6_9HYPH|nr:hypothetical protein EMEDMD4_340032 [Sinorhizobium medicae]
MGAFLDDGFVFIHSLCNLARAGFRRAFFLWIACS